MLRRVTAKRRSMLKKAAELRAAGCSWATVAKEFGCAPDTCRRWTSDWADEWKRLYAEACENVDDESRAESIATLRSMLRSEDDRLRQGAAKMLNDVGARRGKPQLSSPPVSDLVRIATYVESLDESELREFLAEFLPDRLGDQDRGLGELRAADAAGTS